MSDKKLYVLSFSTDRNIFTEGSLVRKRMEDYATIAEELHIIVFTRFMDHYEKVQIAPNAWVYPSGTYLKWWYPISAYSLAKRLFYDPRGGGDNDILKGIAKINLVTTQDPFETGVAGYLAAKKLHAAIQFQIHADFLNPEFASGSFLNNIRVRIAKFFMHEQPSVRVVSNRIKNSILTTLHFKMNKAPSITVLPIYTDVEKFRQAPPSRLLREKYPGYDLLMLSVGRLEKEKNMGLAIRILATTLRKKTDLTIGLVIVGDGSQKAFLQKMARDLHIADNVYFEGYAEDLTPYYKSADLFLMTSKCEGYGLVLAEAAASGCPILTMNVGAAPEIVNRWNGIMCSDGDEECLLMNVIRIATDLTGRTRFLDSARRAAISIEADTKEEYLKKYREGWESSVANEDFNPGA